MSPALVGVDRVENCGRLRSRTEGGISALEKLSEIRNLVDGQRTNVDPEPFPFVRFGSIQFRDELPWRSGVGLLSLGRSRGKSVGGDEPQSQWGEL